MTPEFENIEEEKVITEYEKAQNYVNEIMYQDVYHSIKYDEWSAREYGEDKVDTFDTAMNLYEKGYRREIDVLEEVLDLIREDTGLPALYAIISQRIITIKEKKNES